ncbi:hypothetical protein TNCT_69321 [Trichonephila clavata]|uniref:Uncharacterized protein n=1 Tax=Trichonephila clavata TaxID=2740835 RepID=A0A8X6KAI0_TRICU|nr:hypothetical protein TNCT_69321 [Trichonephila clavata]
MPQIKSPAGIILENTIQPCTNAHSHTSVKYLAQKINKQRHSFSLTESFQSFEILKDFNLSCRGDDNELKILLCGRSRSTKRQRKKRDTPKPQTRELKNKRQSPFCRLEEVIY